jgi:hypothetical protein
MIDRSVEIKSTEEFKKYFGRAVLHLIIARVW